MSIPAGAVHKAAYIISAITHPIFVPFWGFLLFNSFSIQILSGNYLYIVLGVFFLTSIVLPSYFIMSLKRYGVVHSYEMHTLDERRWPLLGSSALLVANYYMMQRMQVPGFFQVYFLASAVAALAASAISIFYKISLHTLAMGFLFGIGILLSRVSAADIRIFLVGIVLLAGITGTARYALKAHTLTQIYLGFITGALVGVFFLLIL